MGVPAAQASGPEATTTTNFDWTTSIEPHAARRRAILAKYGPQVRALYGTDPWTAVQVWGMWARESGGRGDGVGTSAA